ncbi:MAG: hypothetical protein ABUS49_02810 [Acidobacteriota bacterium]
MPGKPPSKIGLFACCLALLAGCGTAPAPVESVKRQPVDEPWYAEAVTQLNEIDREAESLFQRGKPDDAAARIQQGEPLASRLLSVPRPTLQATEAASDLDQLYGRMLLSNRRYGWARLQFQKNLARWKHWQPSTPETERRLRLAQAAIAECDRHITE